MSTASEWLTGNTRPLRIIAKHRLTCIVISTGRVASLAHSSSGHTYARLRIDASISRVNLFSVGRFHQDLGCIMTDIQTGDSRPDCAVGRDGCMYAATAYRSKSRCRPSLDKHLCRRLCFLESSLRCIQLVRPRRAESVPNRQTGHGGLKGERLKKEERNRESGTGKTWEEHSQSEAAIRP